MATPDDAVLSLSRPSWSASNLRDLAARYLDQINEVAVARIPTTLKALLQSLGTRLGVDRTTLFTITPDRQGFAARSSWHRDGVPAMPLREFRVTQSRLVERALRGRPTIIERVEAYREHSSADIELLRQLRQRSLLVLPIRVGGGTVGAHSLGGVFSHFEWPRKFLRDLQVVETVIGVALQRLLLHEQIERAGIEHEHTQRIAGVGHWRYDFASKTFSGSAALLRALRLDPRADLELSQMLARVHAEDRGRFGDHVEALLRGTPLDPIECRARLPSGRQRWFRCWGEVQSDAQGLPLVAHGVLHDITDRKGSEASLERINRRLVQAQEDERARLGRELHDDLGQRVTALVLQLDSLTRPGPEGGPSVEERLPEMVEQLSELGLIVRDLSRSLHPADLRRLRLQRSLASLCSRCSMIADIDVELEVDEEARVGLLPDQIELALFRVVQESLSNALRHAAARHVVVSAGSMAGRTWVEVRDDGEGFEPEHLGHEAGLGLLGMKERMRLVGGTLGVVSRPGKGTSITAEVPFEGEKVAR